MAKWAFLTVLLYILLVVLLFGPVVFWASFRGEVGLIDAFEAFLEGYGYWQFWLMVAVIVAIQAALLLVPVRAASDRPRPKRHIWVPAVAAAFAFSTLVIGFFWSIAGAIWGDDVLEGWFFWASLGFGLANWVFWTVLFWRFSRDTDARGCMERLTRWLIRGSVLELLVAVPSHIIVRNKEVCCAPGLSFCGIVTGLALMAVAFGPGLFFLFHRRFSQLKPHKDHRSGKPVCEAAAQNQIL